MHSQSSHIFLLICPQLLAELKSRPECNAEYIILYSLGMAWLAWDMKGLDDLERARRIELIEVLLIFYMGGEQLFLPFQHEASGDKGTLVGILSSHMGVWSMQNMLALMQNAAARHQFKQQFPHEIFNERAASNNDVETFFSLIAGMVGYKPRLMELQAIAAKVDYNMRTLFDPTRRFYVRQSKKKMYDPVEFLTVNGLLEWNDGSGIDLTSARCQRYLMQVALRAMRASRGKMSTVRDANRQHSNVLRGAMRSI